MKLRRFKVDRLEEIKDLFWSLAPIVWVGDQTTIPDWYPKIDLRHWLDGIEWSITNLIHGYYECWTFEDEHFLTYGQVFGD